jgi:hypothetical protein
MVLTVPTTRAGVQALIRAMDQEISAPYLIQDPDKDCQEAGLIQSAPQ